MSLKAIFGNSVSNLQAQTWSDPEVQKLVDVLSAIMSSDAPLELDDPLKLVNNTSQAAIQVTGINDSRALEIKMAGNMVASVGVGLGNTGIVANEFIPRPEYFIPQETIDQQFSLSGQKGGSVTQTPGSQPVVTYSDKTQPAAGTGWIPTNTPGDVGGSTGQSAGTQGRGTGYKGPPVSRPAPAVGGVFGNRGSGEPSPPVATPVLRPAGATPVIRGRRTGTGRPGVTHNGMQTLAGWGDVLGYAQHGTSGLELSLNNTRYRVPLASGSGSGATSGVTYVSAVSCNSGTLSVTTGTLNFVAGLFTGAT